MAKQYHDEKLSDAKCNDVIVDENENDIAEEVHQIAMNVSTPIEVGKWVVVRFGKV